MNKHTKPILGRKRDSNRGGRASWLEYLGGWAGLLFTNQLGSWSGCWTVGKNTSTHVRSRLVGGTPINKLGKKAQIPTLMIPFIALVISIIALYIFVSFSGNFELESGKPSQLIETLQFNHEYIIAQTNLILKTSVENCKDCTPEQLKTKIKDISKEYDLRIQNTGNCFGKLRNKEFTLIEKENTWVLEINDLFVTATMEENQIQRNFELKIETSKDL